MIRLIWPYEVWNQYLFWFNNDKSVFKKINQLICDIYKNPVMGIGKPEKLKYMDSYIFYSRRINEKDRLIYYIDGQNIVISSCKSHYNDK